MANTNNPMLIDMSKNIIITPQIVINQLFIADILNFIKDVLLIHRSKVDQLQRSLEGNLWQG